MDRTVGVFDLDVGVFALTVGSAGCCCCREVLPLAAGRFPGAGEFDLVETGLLGFRGLVTLFTETGRREEGDMG